jgi:hypothetical protein
VTELVSSSRGVKVRLVSRYPDRIWRGLVIRADKYPAFSLEYIWYCTDQVGDGAQSGPDNVEYTCVHSWFFTVETVYICIHCSFIHIIIIYSKTRNEDFNYIQFCDITKVICT